MKICKICQAAASGDENGSIAYADGDSYLSEGEVAHTACMRAINFKVCSTCEKVRHFVDLELRRCSVCRGVHEQSATIPDYNESVHGKGVILASESLEEVAKRLPNLWG